MVRHLRTTLALLFLAAPSPVFAADSVLVGHDLYRRQCAQCHDDSLLKERRQGPPLFGVVGRKAGSVERFGYSDALKKARTDGKIWDETALDAYLADPEKAIPGTTMPVAVVDKSDRAMIIAYLKSLDGRVRVLKIEKTPPPKP